MIRTLVIGLSVLAALPAAHAAETRMSKTNGDRLLQICSARLPSLQQGCEAYIDGVADMIGVVQHRQEKPGDGAPPVKSRVCVPGDATGAKLRDVVVGYLHAHPADHGQFAAILVAHALQDAFPCP